MSAEAQLELLRQLLQKHNLPITADNLNRAALAVARNSDVLEPEQQRQQRSARPTRPATPTRASPTNAPAPPTNAPAEGSNEAANARALAEQDNMIMQRIDEMMREAESQQAEGRRERMLRQQEPRQEESRRPYRGTLPSAMRIDEENPTAGMFGNQPPRQADDSNVDPMGVASGLMLPFLLIPGMRPPGVLSRSEQAAREEARAKAYRQYVMRERARRLINQDREALNDPRGPIPRRGR